MRGSAGAACQRRSWCTASHAATKDPEAIYEELDSRLQEHIELRDMEGT